MQARQVITLPKVIIEADDRTLPDELVGALEAVSVQQALGLPTQCELIFVETGSVSLDALAEEMLPGADLVVSAQGGVIFVGVVTAVELQYRGIKGRALHVRGYDRLHLLRKRQTVRAYVHTQVSDLAEELARAVGINHVEAPRRAEFRWLINDQISDFDLLTRLAERVGLYPVLLPATSGSLHLLPLTGTDTAPLEIELGQSLLEARVELNSDPQTAAVVNAGWNYRLGMEIFGNSDNFMERLGGVFGRTDFVDQRRRSNLTLEDASHAQWRVQAEVDALAASEITLEGVALGSPYLAPGQRITVNGLAARFNRTYVLTAVQHVINREDGYVAQISTIPPTLHPHPDQAVVTIGLVSNVADPANSSRVKCRLPAYGEVESDWLQVISAGAGSSKGLTIMPDIHDQVLLLFTGELLEQGFVLGGLFSALRPDDTGVHLGRTRRFNFQTQDGQRIQLDGVGDRIRMENRDGSFIEVAPDTLRIFARANIDIEAPGRRIRIRGDQIDFERE